MTRHLHTARSLATLEETVFERAAAVAGSQPASVLYLTPSDRPADEVRECWTTVGSPLQLEISDFDTVVSDVFERQFYETRITGLSAEERQRLVERAVDSLDDPRHPLATRADAASAEACSQSEDLLSLLEFAGLTDPANIRSDTRLNDVSPDTREALAELSAAFDTVRGVFRSGDQRKSLRSERYERILAAPDALAATLDSVDVVVLGPFSFFSPLEARLIDAIADTVVETHAVLPLAAPPRDHTTTGTEPLAGIDRGAERAWDRYADLGFTIETAADTTSAESRLAAQLYRFTPESTLDTTTLADAGLDWHTYPTPTHEIRGVAREVREELANGRSSDQIGVVLPSAHDAQQDVFEIFDQYGIPVTSTRTTTLSDTELGAVLEHALQIGSGDGRVQDLVRLAGNPLVDPSWPDEPLDTADLVRVGERVEVTSLDALADVSPNQDRPAIQRSGLDWITDRCRELHDADPTNSEDAIHDFLATLGVVKDTPSGSWELSVSADRQSWIRDRERAALRTVRRVASSLAESAALDDRPVGDRLSRALASTDVDCTLGTREGVELLTPAVARQHDFDVVLVLGLTQSAFPSRPTRLAFTREINDAHADFEPGDPTLQARYALGLLPAQVERLVLSHPAQTADGEDTVVADFLAELQRLCTDDLEPTHCDDDTHPPKSREDVQRAVGTIFDAIAADEDAAAECTNLAARVADTAVFEGARGATATRLRSGVACAVSRRSPETTEYDGWLSPETHEQFANANTPMSPSRVDSYATCGFKFYMDYRLGYDAPDEQSLEPDAGAAGQFVHEVLARLYKSLQDDPGDPVSIDDPDAYHDAMYEAAMTELDRPYIRRYDSVFHEGWLTRLLAGLTPDNRDNEYAGPPGYRGLFVRVLEAVADEQEQVTTRPALFEAAIGLDTDDGDATTVLDPDPVDLAGVSVRGKVDRVDVVPDTDPREFVALDYKTGSSPSIQEVRGGVSFQLPLYLRLLDAALPSDREWTPIGAAYYDLDVPSTATLEKSPLTADDHAAWHGHSGKPLLRHSSETLFDSPEDFREFLFETTDQRLRDLSESIEQGIFHPTLLDAETANCEYCEYAHVCDVRHHQREDRLSDHGTDAAYVPDYAELGEGQE